MTTPKTRRDGWDTWDECGDGLMWQCYRTDGSVGVQGPDDDGGWWIVDPDGVALTTDTYPTAGDAMDAADEIGV